MITARQDPDRDPDRCAWFLLCENPATFDIEHPTLGTVGACARCLELAGIPAALLAEVFS